MNAHAARIMLLWGWQRWAAALCAGAVSALALPPFSFPLVLFFTLPVLVWLLDGAVDSSEQRRVRLIAPAFAAGWWFGFGYFLTGLNWIGHAFLVDGDTFGWMMPFAVVLMPAGLALFFGAGTALARLLWSETPWRIFALAFSLGLTEWLRGHILTGFPWNLPGYALTVHDLPMQMASVVGVYGLTVIVLAIAAAPAALGDERPRALPAILAILSVGAMTGYGAYRLDGAGESAVTDTRLRLVQPNIVQAEKWLPENRARIFAGYLDLSRTDDRTIDAVIWPEAAVPFSLTDEPGALSAIAEALPVGRYLITGANRAEASDRDDGTAYFNSAFLVDDAGGIVARYDKNRLVPFGETVPFERVLESIGLRKLVAFPGSFSPGRRADPIEAGRLPAFRTLICYEVIFSGRVLPAAALGAERPTWLLNLTNDAWFGDSAGPRQHFHHAKVRAAEEGLPLVRVANTGISGLIDPYGRTKEVLSLNTRGALDIDLPMPAEPPVFARYGFMILATILGFSLALALFGKVKRRG